MRKYKAYPKAEILAAMRFNQTVSGTKGPSILDVSQWGKWWESGAKELEKSAPGKIITAPVRLPAAVLTSSEKIISQSPQTLKTVVNTLPIVALAAVVLGSGYLVYRFKIGKKQLPPSIGDCSNY